MDAGRAAIIAINYQLLLKRNRIMPPGFGGLIPGVSGWVLAAVDRATKFQ
jgi:hypothetical protein